MTTPLDGSITPSVREAEDNRLKNEDRANQDQTRAGRKQLSPSLRRCLWLIVGLLLAGGVVWLVTYVRREHAARVAKENFRKIAAAFQDYADVNEQVMPTQAIYDKKTGTPLLSWRVTILPQLGEEALYKQIHLDESWDSPHNRQFWDKMPTVYELPGLPASEGRTAMQVFMGPETPFSGREGRKFPAGFPDGTSSTILIAEAAVAVNWMEPADIEMKNIDPDDIRASLGNRTGKGPLVSAADGHTGYLPTTGTNDGLKASITPAGNEVLG